MGSTIELKETQKRRFRRNILDWYLDHARDLPWRRSEDPYQVWISEIMLQQTRVDQAHPFFLRFIERFPNVERLAAASQQEVLKCWEGLGYYSRARNLHEAAKRIVEHFGGNFPSDIESARSLKGVGAYTAGAVLSIAYGRPVPAIDGNVNRILARWMGLTDFVHKGIGRKRLISMATAMVDPDDPGSFNQAMMDLGATVCTPRNPKCESCPLSTDCIAFEKGLTDQIPIANPKAPIPHHDIAVGVLSRADDSILMAKRSNDKLLGGLWEFPGARRREGESLSAACKRGFNKRVGMDIETGEALVSVKHSFSHFKITMHAFRCETNDSSIVAEPSESYCWVSHDQIRALPLHKSARRIADHLETPPAAHAEEPE